MTDLNPRQKRFVAEYLIDLNASAAAIRAGYRARNARVYGWQLLQRPEIAAAVAVHEQELFDRLRINALRVTTQTARIAFLNPRHLLKSDGTLKSIDDIDDAALAGIAAIETVESKAGQRHKLWLRDTIRALTLLTRQLQLMEAAAGTPLPRPWSAPGRSTSDRHTYCSPCESPASA